MHAKYRVLPCLLLLLLWPAAPALAVLESATVSPATLNAPFIRPATLQLRWTVTAATANRAPIVAQSQVLLVTSPGGGIVLGQVPRLLQVTVPVGASTVIPETVQLPRSLMQTLHAARDRAGNPYPYFEVYRSFSDADSTVLSTPASLHLTGGGGSGQFEISRLALYFEDQTTVGLVARGKPLQAVLEVQFSGSGQLAGRWEVADPMSTAGEPIFRPLRLERSSLVGARSLRIESPELPTELEGAYLLRFQLTSPRTDFEPVVIRYLVTGDSTRLEPPLELRSSQPHNGALVEPGTRFSWYASQPAAAWLLEIFRQPPAAELRLPALGAPAAGLAEQPEDPPLTGMLLSSEARSTLLSALVWQRLEPGRGYWWRVRAIGADGRTIGESPLQEFRTP